MEKGRKEKNFNPGDNRARRHCLKSLKRAREKLNLKGEGTVKKKHILANYISSLGIGSNALNILNTVDLTIYQLFKWNDYGIYSK